MVLYPVIMCGGAGTRLWPASRPSRPKQFLSLMGGRSLFQEAVARVAPLVSDGAELIVVGGVTHRRWIVEQLAEIGVTAQVLLEPEARDSAPAMAAAAIWAHRRDPSSIVAFVASDHHIPDHDTFRHALLQATAGAGSGQIVTLGLRPTAPSPAYGYIKPGGRGLSPVAAFVEKPDAATAAAYIADGYLWNSGTFIVSTRTFIDELKAWAPEIEIAVSASIRTDDSATVQTLSESFGRAPRISVDYAVMEKTTLASVLEVDFAWSDLGTWDTISATGQAHEDRHILEDTTGCLIRAPEGMIVGALGLNNLVIIAEADAVLVCDLDRAHDVKQLVEQMRTRSPRHLDFARDRPESLTQGGVRFADWLRLRALPVWSTLGVEEDGMFAEALLLDGRVPELPHRIRVQTRQIYAYAQAGTLGWTGPWRTLVLTGLTRLYDSYLQEDGRGRALVSAAGLPIDGTAMLYDQIFVLFALAAAKAAGIDDETLEPRAIKLRDALLAEALPNGALKEFEPHPYQANAHMHLLETCLAWEEISDDPQWARLADRVAGLALDTFIDPDNGFLREFFNADWKPAGGDDGHLVEPGHQFEWTWLLSRYGRRRGDQRALAAAARLYTAGRSGILDDPEIVVDALNDDGSIRSSRARLWPQSEWIKAALILAETATPDDRIPLLEDAATALKALWLYLTPDGLWHDKRLVDGGFVDEPAPATSLYHIMAAFQQLTLSWKTIAPDETNGLDLG